jgi:hypothetical protein
VRGDPLAGKVLPVVLDPLVLLVSKVLLVVLDPLVLLVSKDLLDRKGRLCPAEWPSPLSP